MKKNHKNPVAIFLSVFLLISMFGGIRTANAGPLAPSSVPAATSYTLSDIFSRLTTGASATAGSHTFAPTTTPQSIFPTLSQIYSAIPIINAAKLLSDTTYLGVTGSVQIRVGDNSSSASATTTNKLILTVPTGYYGGSATVSTTSTAFTASNIANGVNLFGIVGTFVAGFTYGDSNSGNVLTTAVGAGTYDPSNLIVSNVKSGIAFGTSSTGTLLPSGGTAVPSNVATGTTFYGGSQANWTLQTGTLDPYSNQKLATKDDWVNSAGTVGEYTGEEATWSAVTGSPFSGYNTINYLGGTNLTTGTVKQDTRTGLWWTDNMGNASTTDNNFTLAADGSRPTGGGAIGFCNALNTANFAGHNDWYLPTQKQLMQAYIDGAANNMLQPGYTYWSSTEDSGSTLNAWSVNLGIGRLNAAGAKTGKTQVMCVRP